jgi:hypothetical protein
MRKAVGIALLAALVAVVAVTLAVVALTLSTSHVKTIPTPHQKCVAWVIDAHPENATPGQTCTRMATLDPKTFAEVYGK